MSKEESKRHSFDAYCKRLVKNEAIDIQRKSARQGQKEISFSELNKRDLLHLQYMDDYPSDRRVFSVLNTSVEIENESLGAALAELSPERRIVVLLSYLLDMKDREIAEELDLSLSTVHYRRTSALTLLRKLMEGYVNE